MSAIVVFMGTCPGGANLRTPSTSRWRFIPVRSTSVCLSVCLFLRVRISMCVCVCVCGYHISHACAVVQVRASSDIKHGEEDKLCR